MMIIVLEEAQSSQFSSTPLLLPLCAQVLKKPCSYIQEKCLEHFKQYLSPFISSDNLQLSTTKAIIEPDCPIFFYTQIYPCTCQQQEKPSNAQHYNNYVQTIFCKIAAYSEKNARQRRLKLVNTIMLKRIDGCPMHPLNYSQKQHEEVELQDKYIHIKEVEKVDKILGKYFNGEKPRKQRIYVNGKQICLLEDRKQNKGQEGGKVGKWSELLAEKWEKWVSKNSCLYVLY